MGRLKYLVVLIILAVLVFLIRGSDSEFSTYAKELEEEGYTISVDGDSFVATKEGENSTFVLYETTDSQIVQYENKDVIYTFDVVDKHLEVATMGSQPNGEALCPSVQTCEEDYFFQILYYKFVSRIELIDISTRLF